MVGSLDGRHHQSSYLETGHSVAIATPPIKLTPFGHTRHLVTGWTPVSKFIYTQAVMMIGGKGDEHLLSQQISENLA
ncbi:hypothetical protein V9T40_014546 [Parthenolecanium corni]|uniref:Uncharacterized protein n=1 Tax=Parthenolecanium corni TaxID=536013 RepID=A0AAN9T7B1_9HEMI